MRELKVERERVARVTLATLDELRPVLREKLRTIGDTLRADVAHGRLALGALLGDRRIRIYHDGRIEGAVALETLPAPSARFGAGSLGGSGGPLRPCRSDEIEAAFPIAA